MVKMMSQDKMIGRREILSSSPSPWFSRFLRATLLLLMMTLAVGEMWGQPETGYYRLKSCKKGNNKYYYMCPANENDQFLEEGKPFLTTHQLVSDNPSFIWLVQKFDDDYYYIIHHEGDKDMYITTNDAPATNTTGDNRRRLHLEELGTPDAKEYLFKIGYAYTGGTDSKYNIWNKELIVKVGTENHKYLSISGDHNDYYGSLNDDRGMIGLYSKSNDTGVQWQFEPYDKCLPPVITCEDGTVSIECATEGRTIYYTTTGEVPDPTDETQRYNAPFPITSETTVKAIAVKDNYENSKIVSKTIKQVDAPTIAFDQTAKTITLSPTTEGVDYYYTTAAGTVAPDNPTKTTGTQYSAESGIAFSDNSITTINVIAFEDGKVPSASTTKTIIYMPDITLESESYTYDGSAKTPSITSVMVGETTVNDYGTPTYEDNIEAGTATVTIRESGTSDKIIYGTKEFVINPAGVTLIANSKNTDVYDGTEKTVTGYTCSVDGLTFAESVTASGSGTDAGDYDVTFIGVTLNETKDNTGNYVVTVTTNGTLTIKPKAVTITAKDASKAYNGSALTEDGFEASALEASDTHTFTVAMTEGSSITNVGNTPNVIATVDGVAVTTGTETTVGNYLVTTANGTLKVTAKAVTITAKDGSKAYDGSPLTEGGFTTTVLEDGDTHTFTVAMTEGSTITNAGNTPNEIATVDGVTVTTGTQTAVGNYLVTTASGTLTVNPASVTLTANSRNTDVYDGTEKTVTGFICKMGEQTVEGLTFAESVAASGSGTNAGEYDVTFTGVTLNETKDNTGNYVVTGTTNGTLTINPLTVEITWVGTDFAYTYNGNSQAPTATASGTINDEEVIVTIIPSAQDGSSLSEEKAVNVGSYIAKATALSNSNYTLYKNNSSTGDFIDNIEQAFTIVPAELTAVTIDQTELIYNGLEQTVTVTSVKAGELNVTDVDYVVSGNAQTNANAVGESYTVIVKAKENTTEPLYVNNFTGEVTTTFTIQPKPIGVGDDDVRPLASGFSVSVGEGNTIILKDGETPLTENIDYTVGVAESSASGRYSVRKITGQGNYGSFTNVRNAIVHFINDGNGGSVYSATFVAEPAGAVAADDTKGHALPDGITAYIITAIDGNTVNAVPLEYIPEGVPVLLLSNANVSGFLVEDATVTEEQKITDAQKTANMLEEVKTGMAGFVSDTEDSNFQKAHFNVKTIYLLYMNEFVYNMEGYLAKGKVYLNPNHPNDPSTASTSPSPTRLMIMWGEDNGIDTSHLSPLSSQLPDMWYSIDGRRLSGKPTRKGLYLKNGQKIVVR